MNIELDNVTSALSRLYTKAQLQHVARCIALPTTIHPDPSESRRAWLDHIRELCMAADQPETVCRLAVVHARQQREEADSSTIDVWWDGLLENGELQQVPDWAWTADKMFTKRYKFIVADCATNQSVDDLDMPLPEGDDIFAVLQRAVKAACKKCTLACTQLLSSSKEVRDQFAAQLVVQLADTELKHERIELVEQSQMKGSVFASVWEDLPLRDCLWQLLLKQLGPLLDRRGFTLDRFGLQTCMALLKATTGCAAKLEGQLSAFMHGAVDRFRFDAAGADQCKLAHRTLIVAFSSMGNGLVRHEFGGSLQVGGSNIRP